MSHDDEAGRERVCEIRRDSTRFDEIFCSPRAKPKSTEECGGERREVWVERSGVTAH